jgi:RNA polymerase sigma-70 factor (ECF subfamily)
VQESVLPRIAQGDTGAVDECVERYGRLIWSLALRYSPSTADAEDAVQEIFIDLWRNAWRFRENAGREATFVSTLARRRLIDRRRKADRRQASEPLSLDLPALGSSSASASIERDEDLGRAVGCLKGLGERERSAVELAIFAGLSQSAIAERLQAPLGSVKTVIRRALRQLRDCMGLAESARPEGSVA